MVLKHSRLLPQKHFYHSSATTIGSNANAIITSWPAYVGGGGGGGAGGAVGGFLDNGSPGGSGAQGIAIFWWDLE